MSAYGALGMPRVMDRRHTTPIIESLMYKFPTTDPAQSHAHKHSQLQHSSSSSRKNPALSIASVSSSESHGTISALKSKLHKSLGSRH